LESFYNDYGSSIEYLLYYEYTRKLVNNWSRRHVTYLLILVSVAQEALRVRW